MLVGHGYRPGGWPDVPAAEPLDSVAGEHAVVLYANDLHQGWVSSAARRLLTGRSDGPAVPLETDFVALMTAVRERETDRIEGAVRTAALDAARRGVVGIVELEGGGALAAWTERVGAGVDLLRVECGFYRDELDEAAGSGLRTGDPVPGTEGLVTQGRFKVVADGSLSTRSAYCHDPYVLPAPGDDPRGMLLVGPDELRPLVARAAAAGLPPAIHAIGDLACTYALDVIESVGCGGRIEHVQLVGDSDLGRFAALGVEASVQPVHCTDDRDEADRSWAGRTGRAFPYAALHVAGARLLLGSDAPVAPLDPWAAIASAVLRTADDRAAWHPEQTLDLETALDASVPDGLAVRPGTVADLVVLDFDPLATDPATLPGREAYATMVGGRWTWGPR